MISSMFSRTIVSNCRDGSSGAGVPAGGSARAPRDRMTSTTSARLAATPHTVRRSTTRILPAEDAFQSPADRAEHPLDGSLHALLHVALVDRAQTRRNIVAILEILSVRGTPFHRPQVRHVAEILRPQFTRRLERVRGQALRGTADEVRPDLPRQPPSGLPLPNPPGLG